MFYYHGSAAKFDKFDISKYLYTVSIPGTENIEYHMSMGNIQHCGVDLLKIVEVEEILVL